MIARKQKGASTRGSRHVAGSEGGRKSSGGKRSPNIAAGSTLQGCITASATRRVSARSMFEGSRNLEKDQEVSMDHVVGRRRE